MKRRNVVFYLMLIIIFASSAFFAMEADLSHVELAFLTAIANNNYASIDKILEQYQEKNKFLNRHISINGPQVHYLKLHYKMPWHTTLQQARDLNTNIKNDNHLLTPLAFAVALGNKEMATYFYEKRIFFNKSINVRDALYAATDYNPAMIPVVLSWGVSLDDNIIIRAVETDNVTALQELVKQGAQLSIKINKELSSLLHLACSQKNCLKVAQFLLDNGINIDEPDIHGCTPLHEAAGSHAAEYDHRLFSNYGANSKALDLLLNHGANVKAVTKDGRSVTECLSPDNSNDMKKLICSGAPLPKAANNAIFDRLTNNIILRSILTETLNDKDLDPLMQFHTLKQNTRNNLNQKTLYGLTPLHFAVIRGNKKLVDLLLVHKKSPSMLKTIIAHTPFLSRFVKNNQKPIVNINCRDNEGRTPLMWAARLDYDHIYQTLKRNGAKRMIADQRGNIALNYAANYGSMKVFEMMMTNEWPNPIAMICAPSSSYGKR